MSLKFQDRRIEDGQRYLEDYLFWLELLKQKYKNGSLYKAIYLPMPLFYYRWHGLNDTGSVPEPGRLDEINEKILELFTPQIKDYSK